MLKRSDAILVLQCNAMKAGVIDNIIFDDHEAVIIRRFHPSTYMRQDYINGMTVTEQKLRIEVLKLCFKTIFNVLDGQRTINKTVRSAWIVYMTRKQAEGFTPKSGPVPAFSMQGSNTGSGKCDGIQKPHRDRAQIELRDPARC